MQITAIETVRPHLFPNLIFVHVVTDTGLLGLGETFYGAAAIEAHIHAIVAPQLLGEDPLQIARHSRNLEGYVGYGSSGVETRARAAVDLALWDIPGQVTNQPVYNLLGGRTSGDIPIYNTCAGGRYVNAEVGQAVSNWGLSDGRHEDLYAAIHDPGKLARELVDSQIAGMKIWPFDAVAEASRGTRITARELASALEPLHAIREAVGDDIEIMVELHALWDVPTAQQIVKAIEPFRPLWVEDPVRSDLLGGLRRIARDTSVRIAAGETIAGLAAFQRLLADDAIGVVTVDTTWSGGLTTARNVAALAASYGVPVAPHDCTGPVALSACAHLSVATPNVLLQETVRAGYLGWYDSLAEGGAIVSEGRIRPSDDPGLGIRLLPELRKSDKSLVRITRLSELRGQGLAVPQRLSDDRFQVSTLAE